MNQSARIRFIPAFLWFVFTIWLICMPQEDIPELDLFWWMTWIKPDKLVHAVLFGMQFFLLYLPLKSQADSRKTRDLSPFLALSVGVWGMTTEIIQRFVPGRSFDWADWIADLLGIILAFFFSPLIRKWYIKLNS